MAVPDIDTDISKVPSTSLHPDSPPQTGSITILNDDITNKYGWIADFQSVGTGLVVLFFIGFDVFVPFNAQGFVTSYFGVAFAVFVFVLWKILKRNKSVKPSQADLWSGKAEVDAECSVWEIEGEEKAATALSRFRDNIW